MTDSAGPYRCPTPCDPDCEINSWGCHEAHALPKRQEHDPEACEARTAVANLRWLLDAGRLAQLGRCGVPEASRPMYFVALRLPGERPEVTFYGESVPESVGKAAAWARDASAASAKTSPVAADCRGFRWIGQSFRTCDGCGRPAWEHDGMRSLREGAKLIFGGGDDDWEVIPWKPGEAEAIKRKWDGQ